MKVLLALNDLHMDGMGSVAITLVRALRSQGMRVVVLMASPHCDFPGFVKEAEPIFIKDGGWGFVGENLPNMVQAVNDVAEDGDVLIHCGAANWLACVPYFKPGLRVVTGVHSINPSTLKICRAYAERVSAWVCISKGVRDRFLRKLPRKYHHKVHLVCNAIETCGNPKTDYRLVDEVKGLGEGEQWNLRILFLGRIENTSKGCGKLPKILAELRRRGVKVHLDLYGYFHNWERQWWKAVDKCGVREMVTYCGEIAHEEVYPVMTAHDVFIAPSNFEGFSLSTSEAMSAALPIVASSIEGVTDWICEDGKAGFVVPKMDINGFADALEKLAGDENLRRRTGEAERKRIAELASFEAHGKGYADMLKAASASRDYELVRPHCPLDAYVQPEFLKPWGLARLLPTKLKTWLRRFM